MSELAAREVNEHELRIERVLGVVYRREGFEVADNRTPLDELLERENRLDGDEDAMEAARRRNQDFGRMLNYFFADGPHPGVVLRRVYAVAYALRRPLIANMTMADLGHLFGETKAAQSWRIGKIFSGYLKKAGAKGIKAPGQKTEAARGNYARAARGNDNRLAPELRRPRPDTNGHLPSSGVATRSPAPRRQPQENPCKSNT